MNRVILDLCGGTGEWSRPYREAGYDVLVIDPAGEPMGSHREDVRTWEPIDVPVHGILAAPPCTIFSGSGARWWTERDPDGSRLIEGLSIVDACLRLIRLYEPAWWAMENPVGRLRRWIGAPSMSFDPWQYGDGYTKRTLLWGSFQHPVPSVSRKPDWMPPIIHHASPGPERARLRSMTPKGFARAFFEANP